MVDEGSLKVIDRGADSRLSVESEYWCTILVRKQTRVARSDQSNPNSISKSFLY